ncbi:MAG: helix-turn-helix domain-containing protein [Actinobacteria bacterium]|nr:helix-turn-helix domain-containing protein [Actinomycetota bacterium]
MPTAHNSQLKLLGDYIRLQRRLANLSLRQMAELAEISNPYLSQIERGVHEPSMHVLRSIARALNLSAESILEQAGLLERDPGQVPTDAEAAIRGDPRLSEAQKQALLAVYRSYVADSLAEDGEGSSG